MRMRRGISFLCGMALILGSCPGEALAGSRVNRAVSEMTGCLPLIKRLRVGLLSSRANIRDMTLSNPQGFWDGEIEGVETVQEAAMFDMPVVYANYSRLALLRREARLSALRIHLRELTVVRNARGEWNLSALRGFAQHPGGEQVPQRGYQLYVRRLELQVDRVVFRDYLQGGAPETIVYEVATSENFENIHSSDELLQVIVTSALENTPLNLTTRRN